MLYVFELMVAARPSPVAIAGESLSGRREMYPGCSVEAVAELMLEGAWGICRGSGRIDGEG
jgi:hypothetical protein